MDVSFFWVINQSIISIIFIFIIHHIFHVLKKNLTIPKTKDLVKTFCNGKVSSFVLDENNKVKKI